MRRSLASQYRVKTAHHLLNIVALKREMDTYNVDGLLKAASVGQSKEACLKYAGLQAALLIEKQAVASYNFGPDTAAFTNNNPKPAAPAAKPPAARSGAPKPTQMSGFGAPSAVQLKPTSSGGGGYTGGNYMINTQATKPSTAPSNLDRGFLGGIADSQKNYPEQAPGLSLLSPASPPPALNNAGTASRRQAPAPLTASVIPKPQGTANATSGLGYQPTGSGSGGKYSGTKPAPTPPENDMSSKKFKPTADTVDPVEEEYSKQLNEGAAADAKSRANTNMPSLAASSGAEGPAGTSAQEEIAQQSQPGFQRQRIIGSGAPVRTMIGNIRNRRGR